MFRDYLGERTRGEEVCSQDAISLTPEEEGANGEGTAGRGIPGYKL